MNRWRVGEDRGSKETDGCPLICCQNNVTGIRLHQDMSVAGIWVVLACTWILTNCTTTTGVP
jgi:hypothetical protein